MWLFAVNSVVYKMYMYITKEFYAYCKFIREFKDMLDLKDPMVSPVTLETVVNQESRDNEERRAREVTRETKDTPELMDPKYANIIEEYP